MTARELIEHCLTFSGAYEDYPFDEDTPVMRHGINKKIFALISNRNGRAYVNLKCDPIEAEFLRSVYEDITPGWHMNKVHWNTVYLDGGVPHDKIFEMVAHSFELTKPKLRKRKLH